MCVCLSGHISPMEHPFVLKTLSFAHAHWRSTQDSMQYAPRVLHFSAFH